MKRKGKAKKLFLLRNKDLARLEII